MADTAHPPIGIGGYVLVFATLLALTGVTIGVAFLDLGFLNTAVALGIAVLKATLVVLYFMHIRWSSRITRMFAIAGVVWLALLFVFILADYDTRDWLSFVP